MHLDAADVAAKFMDLTVKLESELNKKVTHEAASSQQLWF